MQSVVWIGSSRLAGKGLFTAQAIPQGTKIIPYRGEKSSTDESTKRLARGHASLFTCNTRWDIDGQALSNTARDINPSCDPHWTVQHTTRTMWIVANRDSSAGEALTYNDGYALDEEDAFPCPCGTVQCCGCILAPQSWELLRKKAEAS